ncbi:RNA-directed DNA polymerase from mobile element jockey [Elysia marginata]|uniref:RNA-directed DNA polymerase from mobile element jockey n=1 Tax=Elysia marginata TaxID=1093978 RepID=A0AAV4FDQ2_9GAST|nr:RNA-directed DNA polymerase from mobile element jockey [Elysia marginata]
MRQIKEIEGLKIGGHIINNKKYADDTVLTADSEEKLQELLNKVVEENKNKGLELNSKKTESMIITRKTSIPKCEIKIEENTIKQAISFKYLGTQITSDGRNHQEIKSRIYQAKASFQQMKSIMTNIKISIVVRKRLLETFIETVLLCDCEAWTIDERMKSSLEATEMWFLRRMMRIPWTAKKTNEEILTEAQTTRQLMTKIRKRQAKFVSHVIRRNQLEHLVTTGKFDGKRGRGRPREKMLDSLADWMSIEKPSEMIRKMSCRVGWRSLIAHASRHGT